jgi:hypothetical protein
LNTGTLLNEEKKIIERDKKMRNERREKRKKRGNQNK